LTRKALHILLTILPFFLLSACASGSKSKKDSFISRAYHDLTARDNGYFNAKLLLTQSSETLWESQTEDFTQTLPVYKFGNQESAQGEAANLDEVIKKSSIAIQLHKKSKWVDDCYLLIGKANFYKQDYPAAITSFQYIINKYSDGTRKKKKKKKDEPGWINEKLAHHPVANEAALWIVLTLTEMKDYTSAKTALSVIRSNEKFPEDLLDELNAAEAHLYLKQNQTEQAIKSLNLAAETTKDKKLEARYKFILAQLYEKTNQHQLSYDAFAGVIKLKPDYVTDFYARLYMATQGMSNFGLSADNTIDLLKDMLKEDKYTEFFPLIYNTLADIELSAQHIEEAQEYLKMGIETGDVNPSEKALSYVKLGDIYYDQTEFKLAYNQYDSALISLPREYVRHAEINARRDGLIELVKAINTIETEKRLQYLASLNEFELDKELDKMIADQEAAEQQEFLEGSGVATDNRAAEGSSDFYFYNTSLMSRGYGEFKKVWGNRKLEDNWRRSDKSSFSEEMAADNPEKTPEESEIDLSSNKLTKEDVIRSLPKTPEQIEASNNRIAGALYSAGNIYRQKFDNNTKAADYFRQNINDYPSNPFELQSLYQLYVLLDGSPAQDQYKSTILEKYPNSLFANIIRDPNYLEKQLKKDEEVETYYTATYNLYTSGDLATVRSRISEARTLFPLNPLQPKFDMLGALAIIDTASTESFANALQAIVDKYPTDEVGIKAKAILDLIRKDAKDAELPSDPSELFTYKADEEHYAVILISSKGKESTNVKNKLADFNTANYSLKKLRISSLLFGSEQTLILVKTYTNAADGMEYYNFVEREFESIFQDINMDDSYFFIISKSNYVQLYKSKEADAYVGFFESNYLTQE
jgi:tetratricopeptide (TPR) repeat protein